MIFKRKSKMALLVCIVFLCAFLVVSSAAGAGQPGSDADPLVTKSYVDNKIAQLASQIGSGSSSSGAGNVNAATVAQLQNDVGDLTKFIIDALNEIQALKARVESLENGFVVVEAKAGQKVLLGGGAEVILRSGTATALKGTNGLMVDASSGKDLAEGTAVSANHLLISSRNDGRGLLIKTNAFMIIRGGYTIK